MKTKQLRTSYSIFCLIAVAAMAFCYYCLPRTKYYMRKQVTHGNYFTYNWLRMHRSRTDWRAILKPCSDQIAWGTSKSGWGKVNRSSARTSYISYMDIQPSGQFTRAFIQTQTASGQEKIVGGDFWRVFFTGPASVSATAFDHQNGTYEAIALLMEPGNYSVLAYLDYSLCDGLRDPPEDWFRIGNAQGKEQPDGILGFLDHYIYEPLLAAENITFEILPKTNRSGIDDLSNINCRQSCRSLMESHGRWKNNVWLPYFAAHGQQREIWSTSQTSTPRRGALWIFGDSLAVQFSDSLLRKSLCKEVFAHCICSYNWVYPLPRRDEARGKSLNDNFDFRPNITLDSIRSVLRHTHMKSPDSLLVLNLGLHYPPSINFTTFQKLIDDVIELFRNHEKELGRNVSVIWKTSTSIRKEKEKPSRNGTKWRFLTEPRVRLFDAYATSEMCKAGIEVIDVFPLTASSMSGAIYIVHYNNKVFNTVGMTLETYVKAGPEFERTRICIEQNNEFVRTLNLPSLNMSKLSETRVLTSEASLHQHVNPSLLTTEKQYTDLRPGHIQ